MVLIRINIHAKAIGLISEKYFKTEPLESSRKNIFLSNFSVIKFWPILRYVTFIKLGNAPVLEQFCKTLPAMGGTKLTDTSWISISHLSDDTSEMVQITVFARFL